MVIKVIEGEREYTLTFIELCEQCQIPPEALSALLAHGLLETSVEETQFDVAMIHRIQSAARLQRDLQLNTQGAVLALELMDKIEALREELRMLRRFLS